MTVQQVLKELESLGDEARRKHNAKAGAGENQYGVPMGDIRKVAKKLKGDHALALRLWETGNIEAQLVATLLMKPRELSADELDRLVRSIDFAYVADWLSSYVTKNHPDKEKLREKWMKEKKNVWAMRAGWSLTAERVAGDSQGIDLDALLDRIEKGMGKSAPEAQWTMNTCLYQIGIHHSKLRERAIAIGEKLGLYRDYPCSKGCVSPFAPIAINEMVKRQG